MKFRIRSLRPPRSRCRLHTYSHPLGILFLFPVIANTNNVSPCSGPRLSEIAITTRVARVRNVNRQHLLKRTRKVRAVFKTKQESVSWACLRQGSGFPKALQTSKKRGRGVMGTSAGYEPGVMGGNSDRERLGTRQCLSTCYRACWCQLHVFDPSSDWFFKLSTSAVIG